MAGVERFRDVGGGEFDQDSFASFRGVGGVFETKELILSELFFSSKDGRNQNFGELVDFEEELEECAIYCRLVDEGGFRELLKSCALATPQYLNLD